MSWIFGNNRVTRTLSAIALGVFVASCGNDAPNVVRPDFKPLLDHSTGFGDPLPTTAGVDATGTFTNLAIHGAFWTSRYEVTGSVGTGVINPFLDMQASTEEDGFNTDAAFELNQHRDSDTNALPLNFVPIMTETGLPGSYREFVFDANESNAGDEARFSIDKADWYVCSGTPSPATYTNAQFLAARSDPTKCKVVYNAVVSPGDGYIQGTDAGTKGSGNAFDYRILIPSDNFGATQNAACPYTGTLTTPCGYYVVVYMHLGNVGGADATGSTFEEMSTILRPVPGSLKFVKVVVNDNGGTKGVNDFGIATSAGALVWDAGNTVGSTTTYTSNTFFLPAGTYTMSESDVSGYSEGSWSCAPVAATTSTFNGGSIAVADGDNITCTITNNDQPAELIFIKQVTNDNGGTKVVGDFGISTTAGSLVFGAGSGTTTKTYTATALSVSAGTYTMEEDDIAGYTEGSWECKVTGADDATYAPAGTRGDGSVTVANGQSKTCRIINNDIAAELIFIKVVTNDNGGTKVVGDFGISTTAGSLVFGAGSGTTTKTYTATALAVSAGTYTMEEDDIAGYTEGSWECKVTGTDDATYVPAGTRGDGSVSVVNGQSKTCRIINNDQPAKITLIKRVQNDHGGTATGNDFVLKLDDVTKTLGGGTPDGTSILAYSSGAQTVNAGAHTFTEANLDGYTEGSWSCSRTVPSAAGPNASGAFNDGSLAVANGEEWTCTITNNDDPGTIIIVKVVTGGSGTFDYTGTGTGIGDFTLSPTPGTNDTKTYTGLSAGAYTVDEAEEAGFVRTDLACVETGNVGGGVSTADVASGLSTINLGNGETVTCTYTNSGSLTTRTQGFWATHQSIMHAAWFGGMAGGIDMPGVTDKSLCADGPSTPENAGDILNTDGKVLGGFWSSLTFTTNKKKRSDLDKARMQLAQQLLAAILNNAAFGSAPPGGISAIDAARDAFCGTNIAAIMAAHSAMAAFNESGDSGLFTPGASANGKEAKDAATLIFWNVLPPQ